MDNLIGFATILVVCGFAAAAPAYVYARSLIYKPKVTHTMLTQGKKTSEFLLIVVGILASIGMLVAGNLDTVRATAQQLINTGSVGLIVQPLGYGLYRTALKLYDMYQAAKNGNTALVPTSFTGTSDMPPVSAMPTDPASVAPAS